MTEATVFVVDDDAAVRESIMVLLESADYVVEAYASATAFLEAYNSGEHAGCLVLDVRMPGMGGLELQEALIALNIKIPIIFITGHGDISMSVKAIKGGAIDFLEKPFHDELLLTRISEALERDTVRRSETEQRAVLQSRLVKLTTREREVMMLVLEGKSSKDIAEELNLSSRTVEVHRSRIKDKMGAESVADLILMAISCDLIPS